MSTEAWRLMEQDRHILEVPSNQSQDVIRVGPTIYDCKDGLNNAAQLRYWLASMQSMVADGWCYASVEQDEDENPGIMISVERR